MVNVAFWVAQYFGGESVDLIGEQIQELSCPVGVEQMKTSPSRLTHLLSLSDCPFHSRSETLPPVAFRERCTLNNPVGPVPLPSLVCCARVLFCSLHVSHK